MYWFDNEVLSKYKGLAIHLFSFRNALYPFKHGKVSGKVLGEINNLPIEQAYACHLTKSQNINLADGLYKFLQTEANNI